MNSTAILARLTRLQSEMTLIRRELGLYSGALDFDDDVPAGVLIPAGIVAEIENIAKYYNYPIEKIYEGFCSYGIQNFGVVRPYIDHAGSWQADLERAEVEL
jgi:hypothetical protein